MMYVFSKFNRFLRSPSKWQKAGIAVLIRWTSYENYIGFETTILQHPLRCLPMFLLHPLLFCKESCKSTVRPGAQSWHR